jgi:thioredoxin-related protein
MKSMCALLVVALLASPGVSQTSDRDALTADRLLKEAEATAHSQQKNVLLMFSASWCGPCHMLQSFLVDPAIRPIFDRYFVRLVVIHGERPNDTRHQDTPGADQLLDSLHDTDTSLPLIVMLSSSGKLIVDSVRPVYGPRNIHANIGYPESPTGIDWFLEMLRQAAPSLTSNESLTIQNWLRQHSDYKDSEPPLKR